MQFAILELNCEKYPVFEVSEGFRVMNLTEKRISLKGGHAIMPAVGLRKRIAEAACRDSNYNCDKTAYGVTLYMEKFDRTILDIFKKLTAVYPSLRFVANAELFAIYGQLFPGRFVVPMVCAPENDPFGVRIHSTLNDVYYADRWLML